MAATRASVLRVSSTSTAVRHVLPCLSVERTTPSGRWRGPAPEALAEFPFADPAEPHRLRLGPHDRRLKTHSGLAKTCPLPCRRSLPQRPGGRVRTARYGRGGRGGRTSAPRSPPCFDMKRGLRPLTHKGE
jgi:hypothetical protein